jgi:hypothetical protein
LTKLLSIMIGLTMICGLSPVGNADEINFNRDIRPILAENCFYCHGQDANKRQGELRLDDRASAIESGAIVPGDIAASSIVDRILSEDSEAIMPPPKSNKYLTEQQKKLIEQWIASGAEYESHWAYVAPRRPNEPVVDDPQNWVRNPIDRFVLAKLQSEGLSPSPEADRATLIKRISADLVGLPPGPEAVAAFINDPDPQAYDKLVDRLLQSKHYGERVALPWLDAARYADSNGFQQDGDTWQWMWRDWVVKAYNADMPFDQFTIWQIAGDLLPDATVDQKIASGFNRNHLLNGEGGAIAEEQRFNILFDRVDTTTTNWLAMTMACAQCHDHKYDPITQRDYYRLLDAFNHVPENGTPQFFSSRVRVANPVLELPTEENQKRIADFDAQIAAMDAELAPLLNAAFEGWKVGIGNELKEDPRDLPESVAAKLRKPKKERSDEEEKSIELELRKHFDDKVRQSLAEKFPGISQVAALRKQLADYRADQIPRVMIMSDSKERDTHILERGEYLKPREKVTFGTPEFMLPLPEDAPANRLGFARWLVAPDHPLTARVQVNRMWQYFFGTGIVKTSEDFGVQSEFPLHKDLLDWLAVEFSEGWSMKKMHRLIVTSATYRQSSRMTEQHREIDIENRLFARASRIRMPAMVLRDWALASSGLLDDRLGGAPVYPYQPDGVWESLAITKERDFTYPASRGNDLYRRSLYTFWRRTVGPANMFDASNRQTCRVRLATTSTPLHSLTTLNDPTWVEAARVLAEKCLVQSEAIEEQLQVAFQRVLCREPKSDELQRLQMAFDKQLQIYQHDESAAQQLLAVGSAARDETLDKAHHAALATVCLGILNLDEALTRE